MFKLTVFLTLSIFLFVGAGEMMGNPPPEATLSALQQLQAQFPNVQPYVQGQRVTRLYGKPFGYGTCPEDTAERFRSNHAELFGVQPGELIPGSPLRGGRAVQPLMYDCETGEYKFMLFYYSQHKDQVPVYASELRLLVLNKPGYPLVQAASTLRDLGKFSVTGTTWAQRFDPAEKAHTGMSTFSKLEAVIWAGTAGLPADPVSAVTFIGEKGRPDLGPYEKWRFVCDARTGEILHRESLIIFEDVTGNVSGMVTEGPKSEQCADEVVTALPYAYVNITGGNSTYADENGNFTIANDGVTEVTVESPLRGLYFRVYNQAGSDELLTTSVTPPAAADFLHNSPNNSEHVRAQVNGYANANEVRDFALCYNPNYPVIHSQTNFTIRVNRTDSYCPGNAWYDGSSLNFCASGTSAVGDHPNTSFASVGHHEYGHHLIQCSGSGQGQYGEGMADSVAMLIADDPGLGYGFFWDQCNTPLRNADNTYQYPCTGDIHDCGQLLSGSIWSTRNELAVTYPEDYLDIISNLTINSILLHSGEEITPQITIDFLTLDDTDGDIYNGTPHAVEICAGFGDHNMDCPEITFDPIGFEYPDGRPEMATPGVATTFRVHVIAVSGTPVSGTGQLHYCLDQGSWVTQGMTETAPNEYEAVLPAAYCGSGFEWYVSAEAVAHGIVTHPRSAPASVFFVPVATGTVVMMDDNFDGDQGWVVHAGADIGNWERADPELAQYFDWSTYTYVTTQPEDDHSASGTRCFVTKGQAGSSAGDYDLDGGPTHLTSPTFELAGSDATISYWRWYHISTEFDDALVVSVSNDDGASWVTAETVSNCQEWTYVEWDVSDFVTPTDQVKVRFTADDSPNNSLVEALIDDFKVIALECNEYVEFVGCLTGPEGGLVDPACAKFDHEPDNDVDLADFAAFQAGV